LNTKSLATIAVGVALVAGLTACSTSTATGSPAGAHQAGSKPKVTLVTGGQSLDFYITMACGAQAAAKKFGVDLTVQGPATYSLPQSLQVLNGVIQTHPEGVLLVPVDPTGLNAAVSTLKASKTPVVTVDGQLSEKLDIANLRSDNIAGGVAAADALGSAIGGKGTVAIEALAPTAVYNAQRVQGFQEEMKAKFPDVKLLDIQYDSGDKNKAAQNMSAVLTAHPDLAGIFGAQQTAGEGAVSAVAAAGLTGKVKVASYDADPSQVQGLRDGAYVALVAQAPYYEGYEGTKLLGELISGTKKAADVKYQQFTPVVAVTKDNVDDPKVTPYLYVSKCS
jgi:ribose transport system substrate-binding protein